MGEMIGISKAARLLGLDRLELRRRIDSAGIPTFDGMVSFDALDRVLPNLGFDESEIVERTRLIRENARALRHDPRVRPPDDLAQEVRNLTSALLIERRRLERFKKIFDDLSFHLGHEQDSTDPKRREFAHELTAWLVEKIRS